MNLRKFLILPAALAFLPAAIFAAGTAAGYSRDKKPVSELEISVFSDPDAMFTNVLKARDFGAIPNDGKDDTQAIRKMFDAADQNAKFVFEKGVYDVGMDGKGDYFKLAKKSDILLDGNGAKFRLHRVGRLFSLWEVKNAMLKNFSVETANLPFTGGEVVAVAGDSLYMKAVAPHKIGSDLAARAIIRYDPKNKRYDANLFNVSLGENNTAEKVDEDTLRIKYKGPYPNVGDAIVLRHQIYAGGVCSVGDSKNILIKGIRIYDCAGMGAHFSSSENIALDGFKVKPRKGLWMSLTADATHFNSCRGSIEIINSEFEGMCDDATNIHHMYLTYIGKKVQLSYTATDVEIRYNYDIIAHHTRDRHNYRYTTVTEHLCPKHRAVMEWSPERFVQQAAAIHEDVEHYIRRILEKVRYQDQANKMCSGILNFARKAGPERLAAACRLADSYGKYSFREIQEILQNKSEAIDLPEELADMPEHENIRGKEYYK